MGGCENTATAKRGPIPRYYAHSQLVSGTLRQEPACPVERFLQLPFSDENRVINLGLPCFASSIPISSKILGLSASHVDVLVEALWAHQLGRPCRWLDRPLRAQLPRPSCGFFPVGEAGGVSDPGTRKCRALVPTSLFLRAIWLPRWHKLWSLPSFGISFVPYKAAVTPHSLPLLGGAPYLTSPPLTCPPPFPFVAPRRIFAPFPRNPLTPTTTRSSPRTAASARSHCLGTAWP